MTRVPQQSVWWKPLPNSSAAAVLFNAGNGGSAFISFRFDELAWRGTPALASSTNCTVRSVWDGRDVGVFETGFGAQVNGHSAFFAIVSGCSPGGMRHLIDAAH